MNRRGFFGLLAAAAVVPLVPVPELLLPTRTIFLPPRCGWLGGNRLLTHKFVTDEMLRILTMTIEFSGSINREYERGLFEVSQDGGKTFHPLPEASPSSIRIIKPLCYAS